MTRNNLWLFRAFRTDALEERPEVLIFSTRLSRDPELRLAKELRMDRVDMEALEREEEETERMSERFSLCQRLCISSCL